MNNSQFYSGKISQFLIDKYAKISPKFKEQRTQTITIFVLTIVALSLFGIFAINPTLSTITQLQKQLDDSKFIDKMLEDKIKNLSLLQRKYDTLQNDLKILLLAIPENYSFIPFTAQIQNLALDSHVKIASFHLSEIELPKSIINEAQNPSLGFSLIAEGNYNNLLNFLSSLVDFERIVSIETVSINKPEKEVNLRLSLTGKIYYKK